MAPDVSDGTGRDGSHKLRDDGAGSPAAPETRMAAIPASELELNRLLEADSHALLLNIRKADYRLQAGDEDLACYFYRRALQAAGDRPLPEEEAAEVRRAGLALAEVGARARARREARLTERG